MDEVRRIEEEEAMNKSQAVADLSFQLAGVTTTDLAQQAIRRAMRVTGLTHATQISEGDMNSLLQALAAEGGVVQQLAEQLAIQSLDMSTGSDDHSAA